MKGFKVGATPCGIATLFAFYLAFCIEQQALSQPISTTQQPAILTVTPDEGRGLAGEAINVQVWTGRATAIDFSRVNERITQVFLADPSRFTYATDVPLDKGEASTLFLRQIQPLKFPNLTTASVTNLFIKTRTHSGQVKLYTFNIQPGESSPKYNGLSVAKAPRSLRGFEPTLQVGSFRPATLKDIERGLQVALSRRYTSPSDPVVAKVREFLALAWNTEDKTLVEIAQDIKLKLPVLTQLGVLGIEESLTPLSTTPTTISPSPTHSTNMPQERLP